MLITVRVLTEMLWLCAGLAPGQPVIGPPGAQPQMVSAGAAPGQRVPFAGLPATAAAARPIQPVTNRVVSNRE